MPSLRPRTGRQEPQYPHVQWDSEGGWRVRFSPEEEAALQADRDALPALKAAYEAASAQSQAINEELTLLLEDAKRSGNSNELSKEDWEAWGARIAAAAAAAQERWEPWFGALTRIGDFNSRARDFRMAWEQRLAAILQRLHEPPASAPLPPPPDLVRAAGYPAQITHDEAQKQFVASIAALPGLAGSGSTRTSALRRLEQAVPGYLAALQANGKAIPKPGASETLPTTADLEAEEREWAKPPRYRPHRAD